MTSRVWHLLTDESMGQPSQPCCKPGLCLNEFVWCNTVRFTLAGKATLAVPMATECFFVNTIARYINTEAMNSELIRMLESVSAAAAAGDADSVVRC